MVVSAPLTSVFVNGVRVDAYPVIHDGVAYLPIQVMAQAMEAEIIWDAKLGTVKVNGVHSPATVYNQNGKVLLPIESFITGLGGNVVYDGRNNMIRVETPDYMANGPSLANGTTASELGGSAHKNNSNSGNHGTTPSIAPAVISTAGTTAALATQSAANGTAIGAQTVTSAGSAIGTQTATAARYSQPTSTGSSYGTYGSPASSSYGTPAASGQAAYGSPASAVQPAYGTPASTAQSSYSIPAGDSTAINTSGSNFMPPQSTYTVKPSFRPPYTAGAQQTATTAYNTPGTMPSSNAVITGTAPNVGINPIPSLSQA
ncbi:hypothetical protein IJT17_04415, partial [bacterium]|nr:hypothetical protein [bacterium]